MKVTYLDVDRDGLINLQQLERAIRPDTVLISIMYANNEIGTIEPVREIGQIAHEHGILFHTDAVQAYGQIPINVQECHIDLLSASAHKFNGPKGAGFLFIGKKVKIHPFMHGGQQERGRRAGTENVPGIVGMAAAAERAYRVMEEKRKNVSALRDYMIDQISQRIPCAELNGHPVRRLPGNINFRFGGVESESVLIMLDMQGICASGGSACSSGSIDPSHVLLAAGLTPDQARSSVRFSLGGENTKEEIDMAVAELTEIVARLRKMRGWTG